MIEPIRTPDPSTLPSPALLIDRPRVLANLRAMLKLARGPERLRTHVKTHKMPGMVRLAATLGITKHKVATIAEAEMVAAAGGTDVLVAYPLVGPNVLRMARLVRAYPRTNFRAVVDHEEGARALSEAFSSSTNPLPVLVDLEVGMGRTGIAPGDEAARLYELVARSPGLVSDGLHAYDGHIRDRDLDERKRSARSGIESVLRLRSRLEEMGLPVPRLVMGGTPTFPIHAGLDAPGVECSPGTCVFHDAGYAANFPDLPFVPAAFLLTRVVSRPRPGRLCLDLGSKAIASDPPAGHRVTLIDLPNGVVVGQSEEHLVVETPDADRYPPGTPMLTVPTHICPTCALHREAIVVEDGQEVERWPVTARDRMLGV
jgi:D-serine deaminase-like pyridoxal phosphate-dependent protein